MIGVSRFKCERCRMRELPALQKLAIDIVGVKWWAPPSLALAQAEAVARAIKSGYCHGHAVLIGDLFALELRTEAARRVVLPGTVEVRNVDIEGDPHENLDAAAARRQGYPIVERVKRFVDGSALSGLVEIDLARRRARVTLQLNDDVVPLSTVIESCRLVHMTATELTAGMRLRRDGR